METLIVSIILVVVIILLISEWIPYDVTALATMAVLMLFGILSPEEALAGFGNPAPITVGALFVVSAGVMRTGALEMVADVIGRFSAGSRWRFSTVLLIAVGLLSAFFNNTPVVLLFIPIVIHVSRNHGFDPSRFLIPLSYISILGGTCTLIGTSTNIIVSNLAQEQGYAPIAMFELARVGIIIAGAGALYLWFVAPRLLPAAEDTEALSDVVDEQHRGYLSQWLVVPEGKYDGKKISGRALMETPENVHLVEVLRDDGSVAHPGHGPLHLEARDILLLQAPVDTLQTLVSTEGLVHLPILAGPETPNPAQANAENDLHHPAQPMPRDLIDIQPGGRGQELVELIVPSDSRFVDESLANILEGWHGDVQIIGLKRQARHFRVDQLASMTLAAGDVLLARCSKSFRAKMGRSRDVIVAGDVSNRVKNRSRAPIAILILIGMIVSVATGGLPMISASLTAAVLMLLTGCVRLGPAMRAIDAHVLLLIIGTIALGRAMQSSGAAALYADTALELFRGAGPQVMLAGIILFTSLVSNFVSNNSSAVLMLPLAIAMADSMGIDARPLIIGTAFGASAALATPIGYQTNLLVYGPGHYDFFDFVKVGLPLNLLVCILATLLIPLVWPF